MKSLKNFVFAVCLLIFCITVTKCTLENKPEYEKRVLVEYVVYAPTGELHRSKIIKVSGDCNKFDVWYTSMRGTNDVYIKDITEDTKWKWVSKRTTFLVYTGTNDCEITNIKILKDKE